MTRSRLLVVALAVAAGLGMLGPVAAATAAPGVTAIAEPGCVVTDATLTWGFKESFRAYIDGDIANGEWTTSGAASYETPEFTWSAGQGRYDPETGYADVRFTGAVRFTGHEGLLDTTIADPVLSITEDGAVLILDVSGPSMEGEQLESQDVSFVELPGVAVSGERFHVTLDSETVLSADGEAAFPDYQAGTAFDPIDVSLELDKCVPAYSGTDSLSEPEPPHPLLVAAVVVGPLIVLGGVIALIRRMRQRDRA
jgi:hypothetical protein